MDIEVQARGGEIRLIKVGEPSPTGERAERTTIGTLTVAQANRLHDELAACAREATGQEVERLRDLERRLEVEISGKQARLEEVRRELATAAGPAVTPGPGYDPDADPEELLP